ncbi:MAG: hypothetical protein BRD24_06000 [Halobacteriales archaeon SW_9_67_24]|nr:MAG: hypothetical protein BRD24_06000 [Halobacteriales archaeon SW_9_67_24]
MNRREVLAATVGVASGGCLGSGEAGSADETAEGSAGTETDASETGVPTTDEETATRTVVETETTTGTDGTTGIATDTETAARTTTERTAIATPAGTTTATATPTETASTTTGTATARTDTPIPIPDAPTEGPKETPLAGEAGVTFEKGGSRIVVEGTITGKNGCQTAVLDSVRRTDAGLVVTIATERDAATNAACSMALVDIEYRFVVEADHAPESVIVVHRGVGDEKTVATADHNG